MIAPIVEQISDWRYQEARKSVDYGRSVVAKYNLPAGFRHKFDELSNAIGECKQLHMLKVCAGRIKIDLEEDDTSLE